MGEKTEAQKNAQQKYMEKFVAFPLLCRKARKILSKPTQKPAARA